MTATGLKPERHDETGKKKNGITTVLSADPEAKTDKVMLANLERAKKKHIYELNRAFNERISAGLDIKGLSEIQRMRDEQLAAIEASYEKHIAEYREKSILNKAERTKFANELFDKAKKTGDSRVAYLKGLFHRIEKGKKDKYFDEKDIVELQKLFLE